MNNEEKKNVYFIDRDPTYFSIILNHLRGVDSGPILKEMTENERYLLFEEAKFYQIQSLVSREKDNENLIQQPSISTAEGIWILKHGYHFFPQHSVR